MSTIIKQWVSISRDGTVMLHHETTGYYRWRDKHFEVDLEGLQKVYPHLYKDAVKQLAEWKANRNNNYIMKHWVTNKQTQTASACRQGKKALIKTAQEGLTKAQKA
jgi:hypothetical protein